MTFKHQTYAACPSCGAHSLAVIESRSTQTAIRRRKQCQACSHRCTTYEVSSDWFQQAEDNARLRSAILKQLSLPPSLSIVDSTPIPCLDCKLAGDTACSLDLPEYGTPEAVDCIHYQSTQSGDSRYIA